MVETQNETENEFQYDSMPAYISRYSIKPEGPCHVLWEKRFLRWTNAAGLLVPTLRWTCALPQIYLATQGSTSPTCSPGDEGHLGQTGNIKANDYFPGTGGFFPHLTLRLFIAKKLLNWALLFCTQVDLAVFRDLDSRLSEREVGPVLWQSYEHKISFVK